MGIETEEENEMKHPHYDKIVAKAANMELVLFVKRPDAEWVVCDDRVLPHISEYEYFLCLPQHKEACLHWLNGGTSQHLDSCKYQDITGFDDLISKVGKAWSPRGLWMDEDCETRIKPKKEKRVIGANKDGRTTSHYAIDDEGCYAVDEIRITGKGNPDEWQFIEIEVEV